VFLKTYDNLTNKNKHTLSSTSALDGGEWLKLQPGRLNDPRERAGNHCIVFWVGLRAGLGRCGKNSPPPGFDPQTVQPVASHYAD
jgi:hypothetical protein